MIENLSHVECKEINKYEFGDLEISIKPVKSIQLAKVHTQTPYNKYIYSIDERGCKG
jgi:hypothetical protein